MIPVQARVIQAEADALAARARLAGTVAALQDRLRPATLIRDARRELDEVRKTARRSIGDHPTPLTVGGGVVALMVFGVPLLRWRRRRRAIKRAARIRGD